MRITWTVLAGEGSFDPSATTVTDTSGLTLVRFTPATHRVRVIAAIDGGWSQVLFETIPRPMGSYVRVSPSSGCTGTGEYERYLFYPDHTFTLRYPSGYSASGEFLRRDSLIALTFSAPGWSAAATLRGDSLVVQYNTNMELSDFESGCFRLVQGTVAPGE